MLLAHSLEDQLTDQPVVLTIGMFDGMHRGHQLLITTAVERARTLQLPSAVLTFDPHPDTIIHPEREVQLLTSLDERIALIEALHPDMLVIAPFDRVVMTTPALEYIQQIAHALPLREIWVGDDFALGRKREGDIARLMEIGTTLGYTVGAVARVLFDGQPVSSTRVRDLLAQGHVADVLPLLGRYFWIEGTVVPGDQRGRTIGFPTANLAIAAGHVLPANGVYACYVYRGSECYAAVTNIGIRPTFDGVQRRIETHLLDFDDDLYGQTLRLEFRAWLRGEQKFDGITALIAQIHNDVDQARALLQDE